MNVVTFANFTNNPTKRMNEAANLAFRRAVNLGYCPMLAREFARRARKESAWWESPEHTARRVVPAMRARNVPGVVA